MYALLMGHSILGPERFILAYFVSFQYHPNYHVTWGEKFSFDSSFIFYCLFSPFNCVSNSGIFVKRDNTTIFLKISKVTLSPKLIKKNKSKYFYV